MDFHQPTNIYNNDLNIEEDSLNKEYSVLEAVDGEDGWNKSINHIFLLQLSIVNEVHFI